MHRLPLHQRTKQRNASERKAVCGDGTHHSSATAQSQEWIPGASTRTQASGKRKLQWTTFKYSAENESSDKGCRQQKQAAGLGKGHNEERDEDHVQWLP